MTKSKLNQLFKDINGIVPKVLILRHNAFAHRSEELNFNDTFKQANVSYNQMLSLTQKSKQVLDQFLSLTGQENLEFSDLPRNHLMRMLKRLRPSLDDKP